MFDESYGKTLIGALYICAAIIFIIGLGLGAAVAIILW